MAFIAMLVARAIAQQVTNPPPASLAPAPTAVPTAVAPVSTPAKAGKKPAAKAAKKAKTAATKSELEEKPVFLSPGKATVTGNNVNVRGKATLSSEIVTRLNSGDDVTVVEEVIRDKPKAGEPSQWAKIVLPAGVHVWVHSLYVDATNKVVLPKRLNVRSGPGENFSVIGLLEKGATVKQVSTKGNWIEIEAPADAYAFMAAMFLKQEGTPATVPPVVSIAPPEAEPAPTPAVVPEPTPVATTTTEAVSTFQPTTPTPEPPATTPSPAPAAEPATATEPAPPPVEEPPPRRIVQHEGVVRGTRSIQAPTKFEIYDPASGRTVNYLYTSSTNLDLSWWKGYRIIVTGEEGLDERWKNTPIITVQRIQVVD